MHDETKYMLICREKNAGQYHTMKKGNESFKSVESFKYLETTLTKLNAGNVCYHLVQNLLFSSFPSKNIKINPLALELDI